jgi:hypothetical protein
MSTDSQLGQRTPVALFLGALVALGLIRAGARVAGLAALLVVVIATVGAMVIGIVVLRLLLLH